MTVFAGEAPIYARRLVTEPGPVLATIADAMKVSHFTGGCFLVVIGPLHAGILHRAGYSRRDVQSALLELSRRSVAE